MEHISFPTDMFANTQKGQNYHEVITPALFQPSHEQIVVF